MIRRAGNIADDEHKGEDEVMWHVIADDLESRTYTSRPERIFQVLDISPKEAENE
jgi:hypothetical protein